MPPSTSLIKKFKKGNLDFVSDENRYQTYSAGLPSLGLEYQQNFAKISSDWALTVLRYSFIFQDPSQDFLRQGFDLSLRRVPLHRFLLATIKYSFWLDSFSQPTPVAGGCKGNVINSSLSLCDRQDQRHRIQVSAFLPFNKQHSLETSYLYAQNASSTLTSYRFREHTLLVSYIFTRNTVADKLARDDIFGLEAHELSGGR